MNVDSDEPLGRDRPLVAVGASLETVRWDVFEGEFSLAEQSIVAKLDRAGVAVVVLPVQSDPPPRLLREIDGILLTGGHDLDSRVAGSDVAVESRAARDRSELALARAALELDIPLLAICRGCQVLNKAAGGTLVEHVPDRYSGVVHTRYEEGRSTSFEFAEHEVGAVAGSPLADVLGERFSVLSSHHQAVDRLGSGLKPAAWSEDGLLEAFYSPDHRLLLGVQWHPENEESSTLFELLAEAAGAHRAVRDRGA